MNNKDWKGNTQSVMATLNSSSHSINDRAEFDYYATPKSAVEDLIKLETFNKEIWEPACGELAISSVLEENGYKVRSSDLINRVDNEQLDFLESKEKWNGDIITNPPFAFSTEFIYKAMELINDGNKIAFFLRIQFLESVKRRVLFNLHPPRRIYVASRNLRCAKNGDFENATGNASTYCWVIFEKGYKGKPELGWFNPV